MVLLYPTLPHLLYRRLQCRETPLINNLVILSHRSLKEGRANARFLPFTSFQIMYWFPIDSWNQTSVFFSPLFKK